ncbi:MAG: ATP-dependent endonuclease [Planctomycetota bacterium]|nr:MAG: ATP-dependent endonuclease [Planctomycetota bacterium]REK26016.1 MAG: ATP-dependent endonuclease [Planctomycetota bacterium]REK46991.1 MAG: ATP-dependent endonuclease [Planctomycetota bacterium]
MDRVRILLVVEGSNDIEFLRRISRLLHTHDRSLPNLEDWERRGELIFVPFGGGRVADWSNRLAPIGKPEFHLYDREMPPETDIRLRAVKETNRRPRCRAVLMRKRSLENYLHPEAIRTAGNVDVMFDNSDSVAEIVAKRCYRSDRDDASWDRLPPRTRRRLAYRAKQWLNTLAVDHMTVNLLHAQDQDREIISWLRSISLLADDQ